MKKFYSLSEEEINQLVERCTQSGLDAYRKKELEEDRRRIREADHAKRMKDILSGYRRIKKTIAEERQYSPQEQREYRLAFMQDLMGDPLKGSTLKTEQILLDKEKKRKKDQYTIAQIDSALALYEQECMATGSEEEQRRFRELSAYYIAEDPVTVESLSELENVSPKTVYSDINIAAEIMYQYVVGL